MLDKKPTIGITLGDFNGIGPEIIIKVLQDNRINKYCTLIVYAHPGIFAQQRKIMKIDNFSFNKCGDDFSKINLKKSNIYICWEEDHQLTLGTPTRESAKAALISIKTAAAHLKEGKLDAIVTAPISKEHIRNIQNDFIGHTEFFTHLFKDNDSLMFLVSEKLRAATMTGHIALSEVAGAISRKKIIAKTKILVRSLQQDFGIPKPKIAILGLNPHASDNGVMGNEEKEMIIPAIQNLKEINIYAYGPYPADGLFGSGMYKKFDAILGMYHDQVLTPFKTIAFEDGVNFTAGLPVVRTSPDHGTAFDIAGENKADPTSFREAIFAAIDILKNRKDIINS